MTTQPIIRNVFTAKILAVLILVYNLLQLVSCEIHETAEALPPKANAAKGAVEIFGTQSPPIIPGRTRRVNNG